MGSHGARAQAAQEKPDLQPQPAGAAVGSGVPEALRKLPAEMIFLTLVLWQWRHGGGSPLLREVVRISKICPQSLHVYS